MNDQHSTSPEDGKRFAKKKAKQIQEGISANSWDVHEKFSKGGIYQSGAVSRFGKLYAIYLDASHWGRGIGRALLHDTLNLLYDRGFNTITLWVLEANTRARQFYEKAGFSTDGTRKTINIERKKLLDVRHRFG